MRKAVSDLWSRRQQKGVIGVTDQGLGVEGALTIRTTTDDPLPAVQAWLERQLTGSEKERRGERVGPGSEKPKRKVKAGKRQRQAR